MAEKQEVPQDHASEAVAENSLSKTPIHSEHEHTTVPSRFWNRITRFGYTPRRCRWDPSRPLEFGLGLNLLFSFSTTFSVANLYYNHPILNLVADDFGVSYERVSIVPTVMQAGYAAGLLFLCPLGDIVRKRPLVLGLTCLTATVWLGLCLTPRFEVFVALSFLTSVTTVTPQLILPLVGDIAPPHKRAHALSIVVSGLLAGMLVARVLSGVVSTYTSWRNVYWIALGMQYLVVMLLYLFMPDCPSFRSSSSSSNSSSPGSSYHHVLYSVLHHILTSPVLVQSCIIGFLISATFTNYWTTLTFLLSSPPYSYSPLAIGLFALIGLFAMAFGPPYSKALLARVPPLYALLLSELICLAGVAVGTYTGDRTVGGPVVQAFAIDLGLQTSQVANRAAIYAAAPGATSRVNTAFMVAVFAGQIAGTAVGNRLYAVGGWTLSGSASVGFVGAAMAVGLLRGPWAKGWLGWDGGCGLRRREESKGSGAGSSAANDMVESWGPGQVGAGGKEDSMTRASVLEAARFREPSTLGAEWDKKRDGEP